MTPPLPALRLLPRVVSLALAVLLLVACGPRDPLERTVAAESANAFAMWRSQAGGYLNTAQLQEVDEAIKELKLQVMNNREATGTEAVETAMRAKIHGRSLRTLLRSAYEAKIKRLEVDLKGLAIATEQNSRLTTRPGDTESTAYLERFRQKQAGRREAAEQDLKSAQDKLKALGATTAQP
ncbi:MAG: hypothetical protein HZA93_00200 [Verrucomicrobia bacterium]|nr:hypothetical protein [Verrucomicrobiota bacterium]